MDSLLIATTNPGKVREIRLVLGDAPVELKTLADVPRLMEPEETGATFAENAWLKARYYCLATGLPTVAEDSGLAIDALGGRPGVESARYPGETYADKFAGLYRELASHARPWTARFVCSVAYAGPSGPSGSSGPGASGSSGPGASGSSGPGASGSSGPVLLYTCEATVEGEIADTPVGSFGFGYDPIFYYPSYGTTLGNVADERKLAVAHRGKAFRQFAAWLKQIESAKSGT